MRFKFLKPLSTSKQRWEASGLIVDIAELSNVNDARYYDRNLRPRKGGSYDYDTYLKLLKNVKEMLGDKTRENKKPEVILKTARIRALMEIRNK